MRSTLNLATFAGLALLLLSAACSSSTTAKSGGAADVVAVDAAGDTGGTTDATVAADTTPVLDVQVQPKDVVVVADQGCAAVLPCAAACAPVAAGADNPCIKACTAQATAAAKTALDAVGACAVSLCADATETHGRMACIWTKCYDKLSTCGEFGAGTATCGSTAACFERCLPGDLSCRYGCLHSAAKESASTFKDLAACVESKCGALGDGDAKAACIASSCQTQANTCKGAGFDCLAEQACLAKCPVPLPNKPNSCQGMCDVLSSTQGKTESDAYLTCQKKCAGSINIPDCIKIKCPGEQNACFDGAGKSSCQVVYNCVKDKCQGIGGDEACITGCVEEGTPAAKDGYVQYEGCILKLLDTQQAKRADCTFPYDESTCLGQIKGLCSNQSNACFQPN